MVLDPTKHTSREHRLMIVSPQRNSISP